MKKLLSIALAVIFMLCTAISLTGCAYSESRVPQKAKERIKMYMDVDVPEEAQLVFSSYSSFIDDVIYTVYHFEEEPTLWLAENNFVKIEIEESAKEEVLYDYENHKDYRGGRALNQYSISFDVDYYTIEGERVDSSWHFIYFSSDNLLIFCLEG